MPPGEIEKSEETTVAGKVGLKVSEQNKVYYYCDREACEVCDNPNHGQCGCNHTDDINHAQNFDKHYGGLRIEKVKSDESTDIYDSPYERDLYSRLCAALGTEKS